MIQAGFLAALLGRSAAATSAAATAAAAQNSATSPMLAPGQDGAQRITERQRTDFPEPLGNDDEDEARPDAPPGRVITLKTRRATEGNRAFNVANAISSLLQAPSYFVQGLQTQWNQYASRNFSTHPLYDPDHIANRLVPESLRDLEANPAAVTALDNMSNSAALTNTGLKYFLYGVSLINHWRARGAIAQEPDAIHRRLLQVKNYGFMGYYLFMAGEKALRIPIATAVKAGRYPTAFALQVSGLILSSLAWLAIAPGSIAMLADEVYKARFMKPKDGEERQGFNIANVQGGFQKFSGFIAREGIQLLAISSALLMALGLSDPETATAIQDTIPLLGDYLTEASHNMTRIDVANPNHEDLYRWVNGSFYMPTNWSRGFAAVSVLGPAMGAAIATGQTIKNAFTRARLWVTKHRASQTFPPANITTLDESIARVNRSLVTSGLGIAGNTTFAAGAVASTFPVYDHLSYYLMSLGFGLMSAQYFMDHPGSFGGVVKRTAHFTTLPFRILVGGMMAVLTRGASLRP